MNAQKPNCLLLIDRIVLLCVVLVVVMTASHRTSATRNTAYPIQPFGTGTVQTANLSPVIKELEAQMVRLPGGTFMMGAPNNNEEEDGINIDKVQHQVTVSAFAMGKYEVTQAQWKAVAGLPKVKIELKAAPSSFKGDTLPVEGINWDEAVEFCERLSKATGKKYRLPTEAEWEYACRSGTKMRYAGNIDQMAWYKNNSGNKTHPVGQKKANGFGLYDMHGNVREWCADWYGVYSSGAQTDPAGPSTGDTRVIRGGYWYSQAAYLQSAQRSGFSPSYRGTDLGFRLVRTS